jgi:hypothetical protein
MFVAWENRGRVMSRRMRGWIDLIVLATTTPLVVGLSAVARAPAPVYRENHTRTFRFKARITKNGGVAPFKVGEVITGTFAYDLKGENIRPDMTRFGRYRSKRNSFSFHLGDLRFTSVGDVLISIVASDGNETFSLTAPDLKLPEGWQMDHTGGSQTYGPLFQNVPPRKVLRGIGLPDRLRLADFVNSRELRLDFGHGVRFPGGKVNERATVIATVERLE